MERGREKERELERGRAIHMEEESVKRTRKERNKVVISSSSMVSLNVHDVKLTFYFPVRSVVLIDCLNE